MNSQDVVPVFDKRDGGEAEAIQLKTWSELGLPWNAYCERGISCDSRDNPESLLARLLSEAARRRETVAALSRLDQQTRERA